MNRVDLRYARRRQQQRKKLMGKAAFGATLVATSMSVTGFAAYDTVQGDALNLDLAPEAKTEVPPTPNSVVESGAEQDSLLPAVNAQVAPAPVVSAPQPQEEVEVSAPVASSSADYSLADLRFRGVIRWGGYKFTYYSQRVLPGTGLRIPGRHVSADGFVCDGDGYIVLANSAPRGTVIQTPFGAPGKVYDRGTVGNHFDVYTK